MLKKYLYFSVTILGNERTFKYLEKHSHLGLEVVIWVDGKKEDSAHIGITPRNWDEIKQKLRNQLDESALFTWRTYMKTVKIWNSKIIELVLKDDTNAFVKPVSYSGSYRAVVEIVK